MPHLKKASLLLSFVLIILSHFLAQSLIRKIPIIENEKKLIAQDLDTKLNLKEKYYQIFNFCQKPLISSFLWVITLLQADEQHYKGLALQNWMFRRFKTISLLSPYFYQNYHYGGLYLSIIKDDDLGAKYLLDRGLKFYPHSYHLNYYAGYHYQFELERPLEALQFYKKLLNFKEIDQLFPLLPQIIVEIENNQNTNESSRAFLLELYKKERDDSPFKRSLKAALEKTKTTGDQKK